MAILGDKTNVHFHFCSSIVSRIFCLLGSNVQAEARKRGITVYPLNEWEDFIRLNT